MLYLFVETVVFTAAFFGAGDVTHFTWWGVLCLLLGNITEILDISGPLKARVAVFAATISFNVAISVVGCSLMRCRMFQDSVDEMGAYTFILGNWALHYHPAVRAIQRWMVVPKCPAATRIWLDAVRVFFVFCMLAPPAEVYGCDFSSYILQISGMVLAVLVETFFVGVKMSR